VGAFSKDTGRRSRNRGSDRQSKNKGRILCGLPGTFVVSKVSLEST